MYKYTNVYPLFQLESLQQLLLIAVNSDSGFKVYLTDHVDRKHDHYFLIGYN